MCCNGHDGGSLGDGQVLSQPLSFTETSLTPCELQMLSDKSSFLTAREAEFCFWHEHFQEPRGHFLEYFKLT